MNATAHHLHCPLTDTAGTPLVQWIAHYTGSCVYGSESAWSWLFGYISLVCWLGAQLPQILTNYRNGSVDGLSLGLVLNWFLGDFTNFVGCVLTHQLPFQTLLAFYYVCVDLVLGGQFYYYTRPRKQRFHLHNHSHVQRHKNNKKRRSPLLLHRTPTEGSAMSGEMDALLSNSPAAPSQPVNVPSFSSNNVSAEDAATGTTPISNSGSYPFKTSSSVNLKALLTSSFVASFSKVRGAPLYHPPQEEAMSTMTPQHSVLSNIATGLISALVLNSELIGLMFAWTCTCCYLTSRMPQIYSNFRRKSTSGTSILLFLAALTGNSTYTLSILLSPMARGPAGLEFLRNELPFLIGSAGTIMFDVTIFVQWYIYRNNAPPPPALLDDDDEEKKVVVEAATGGADGKVHGAIMIPQTDSKSRLAAQRTVSPMTQEALSVLDRGSSSSKQDGDPAGHATEATPLSASPRSYNSL